jgi:hypothetical protein
MAPINLPNGNEVSEVILPDGSSATEVIGPDGQTVFDVGVPDFALASWDATKLTLTDGDSISTFTDSVGQFDLSNGASTYQANVQNGNAVARYGGSADYNSANAPSDITQPFTVTAVVVDFSAPSTDRFTVLGHLADDFPQLWWDQGKWSVYGGSFINGNNTSPPLVLAAVFDGANSLLRENGTQTASGDVGGYTIQSASIGAQNGVEYYIDGDIGEVTVYDGNLDAEGKLADEEQRLAEKWGVSIS